MRSSEEKALNNIHTYIIKFIIEIRQATDANELVVGGCLMRRRRQVAAATSKPRDVR